MKLRYCAQCLTKKPYDPIPKKNSVASGFKGNVCYACIKLEQSKPVTAGLTPKEQAYRDHLAELARVRG